MMACYNACNTVGERPRLNREPLAAEPLDHSCISDELMPILRTHRIFADDCLNGQLGLLHLVSEFGALHDK